MFRIGHLFKNSSAQTAATRLYAKVVEQSRQPSFYIECGVPDTPDGRFDLIALHMALVLRRMRRESETTAEVAQALFDLMFADMDQNLREMGVGDIGVGKRVKAMAQAFYGRLASYGAGLDHPQDDSLANALQRNLFRKVSPTDRQVTAVAGYVRREASFLDDQATPSLVVGSIDFGPPPTMDRGESR